MEKYEITVGIECHVQLATKTKLFSGADNDARGREPNSVISSIDYALPGMLPVLNKEAVTLAVRAAKALNAEAASVSRFDRKHYFYPDLPKGYQTTQMYHPIIVGGYVEAPMEDGSLVKVRIHHAHLEEDAGKLTHHAGYSLVDLNRAGTPLIEIVSLPDIHSAAEAKAYAAELHRLMTYAGVTHGDLYHGNMRFDVNVSIAPIGSETLGTRTEIKNLNSFRSIERAVEYEARRHAEVLDSGEQVVQETRGWSEAKQITLSQRSKEEAQDYRYMPDPDIPPVMLTAEYIAEVQADMPMLPSEYRAKWAGLDLDKSVVNSLLSNQNYARLVTEIQESAGDKAMRRVAHWFASALATGSSADDADTEQVDVSAPDVSVDDLTTLADMTEKAEISSTNAKELFNELLGGATDPRALASAKNMLQISDEGEIAAIVDKVMADHASQKAIEDIRSGNEKAIGYLVGQIMKQSRGKANPALAQKLIKERL